MAREIHLELLLGRRVRDRQGRGVGRVEELRAEQRGEDWVVVEYLIGGRGLLERLGLTGLSALLALPVPRSRRYRVPWEQLDISDPRQPRLRGPAGDLRAERRQDGQERR
jgi:hypothetical protein